MGENQRNVELTNQQKKQFANFLTAFANSSLKDGKIISDYESKVFVNLFSTLSKLKEIEDIYDGDILLYAVEEEILKRKERTPIKIQEEEVGEILDKIVHALKINVAEHLIVIPIANAQFTNIIKIKNLTFIPRNFERGEKAKILSKLSKKKLEDTINDIEHTENSRSENFLEHPLLCIKQTNQSSWVHYDSLNITKFIIYSIRCYYHAYIYKSSIDRSSIVYLSSNYRLDQPSHLAIYSKENWRQRHKPLDFDASLNFDLSWLEDKKKSKYLYDFIEGVYLKGNYDDFQNSFLNALALFNEALFQNNSISTLLNMTIGESLLTRNKNEKRLRLSALLPRLLLMPKSEQKLVSKKLSELYNKRNDFVHDGKSITIRYEYEKDKLSILDEAKKYNAQLILQFTKFEKIIESITNKPNISRMQRWDEYVNSIFQELVF